MNLTQFRATPMIRIKPTLTLRALVEESGLGWEEAMRLDFAAFAVVLAEKRREGLMGHRAAQPMPADRGSR